MLSRVETFGSGALSCLTGKAQERSLKSQIVSTIQYSQPKQTKQHIRLSKQKIIWLLTILLFILRVFRIDLKELFPEIGKRTK